MSKHSLFVTCPKDDKVCIYSNCIICEDHKHSMFSQGRLLVECRLESGVYKVHRAKTREEL